MIVKVLGHGKDAAGLTRYLFSAGKTNEHENQRIIAGSPELHAEWGNSELTQAQATIVGRLLESSWKRQYAPELALAGVGAGGVSRANLTSGPEALTGQAHVFHATIALRADEKPLADEQWREVAETYMRGMGYIGNPDHPDAAWLAVHHGKSAEGNDHIHIAMCTVLRDGSALDMHNNGIQSQRVRRETLERLPYIRPLHDKRHQSNTPTPKAYTAAEHNIARKRADEKAGQGADPDRARLQRIVRAAASQSRTEADFINAVLANRGVRLEPAYWQQGRVTGYKVGLDGGPDFSASKLSADLTLGKLRPGWTETAQSAQLARDLWGQGEGRIGAVEGDASKLDPLRRTSDVPAQLDQAADHLRTFSDQLGTLDVHDETAWSQATADLAGTTAVLATGEPAVFRATGRAADVLAREALESTWATDSAPGTEPRMPARVSGAELATRHVQLALRAGHTDRHTGWLAVMQQIARAAEAIADAKIARGEASGARALSEAAGSYREVAARMAPAAAAEPAPNPYERESERILRERQEQRGSRPESGGAMTEAAERAKTVSDHGKASRPDGTRATGGDRPTDAPAGVDPQQEQDRNQQRPRQHR